MRECLICRGDIGIMSGVLCPMCKMHFPSTEEEFAVLVKRIRELRIVSFTDAELEAELARRKAEREEAERKAKEARMVKVVCPSGGKDGINHRGDCDVCGNSGWYMAEMVE